MYEVNLRQIKKARDGDKEAMSLLIEENNRLIWNIARRFKDRGYPLEDLFQIASLGFIKAIKRFDESFDVRLSTYVVPVIIGEIKRFIRDDGLVKVSRGIKELNFKIKLLQKEHLDKKGEEIGIVEIAKELNVSKEDVAFALDSDRQIQSIDEESGGDADSVTVLADKISNSIDETSILIDRLAIKELIESLENKEKEIVLLRYYKEKTQMQVAKILGISQVQVSRIEKKILAGMRLKLEA